MDYRKTRKALRAEMSGLHEAYAKEYMRAADEAVLRQASKMKTRFDVLTPFLIEALIHEIKASAWS